VLAGDVVEVEQRLHPAHRAGERHDVHTEAQQLVGDVDVLARVCQHDGGARREVGDIGHDACVAQHPCRCLRRLVAAIVEHQPVASVEQASAASAHDTHADDADRRGGLVTGGHRSVLTVEARADVDGRPSAVLGWSTTTTTHAEPCGDDARERECPQGST